MLGHLRAQVAEIDVALLVAGHDDHAHADHNGACRVGAVRAAGDQADIAVALAPRFMKCLDDQEAGVFTL